MKENKFGVAAIKRLLTRLSQVSSAFFLIDQDEDGQISTTETLAFASQLFPILIAISGDFTNLTNEVTDAITSAEWDEIVDHINTVSFIPSEANKEDVEDYVKLVVNWLNMNRLFVEQTIEFFTGDDEDELLDFEKNIDDYLVEPK